jgi:hypothetical protein
MKFHPFQCRLTGISRLALLAVLGSVLPCSAISISVYIAQPGLMASPITGGSATTENFSTGWPAGQYSQQVVRTIGTFVPSGSGFNIASNNAYGGTGTGDRFGTLGSPNGTTGAITLNLTNPNNGYFGMWWSAIDQYNGVSLFNNNELLLRITGADLQSFFGPTNQMRQLTALSGATYTNTQYRGKPGTGNNPNNVNQRSNNGEYYAYIMFQASGLTFNRVIIDNSGTTSTGFEFDNFETRTGNFMIPTSSVLFRTYSVPEPSVWIPTGMGLIAAAWWRRRRKLSAGASPQNEV